METSSSARRESRSMKSSLYVSYGESTEMNMPREIRALCKVKHVPFPLEMGDILKRGGNPPDYWILQGDAPLTWLPWAKQRFSGTRFFYAPSAATEGDSDIRDIVISEGVDYAISPYAGLGLLAVQMVSNGELVPANGLPRVLLASPINGTVSLPTELNQLAQVTQERGRHGMENRLGNGGFPFQYVVFDGYTTIDTVTEVRARHPETSLLYSPGREVMLGKQPTGFLRANGIPFSNSPKVTLGLLVLDMFRKGQLVI